MRRVGWLVTIAAAGVFWDGSAARAQVVETQRPPATLPETLLRLEGRLEEIVVALRELRGNQVAMLILRRIELAEQRLAPLASEARRAQDEARASRNELRQLEGAAENFRNQIQQAVARGAEPLTEERAELERMETMLRLQQERLEADERRVLEAENELGRGRRDIAVLDDELEQLLAGLDLKPSARGR